MLLLLAAGLLAFGVHDYLRARAWQPPAPAPSPSASPAAPPATPDPKTPATPPPDPPDIGVSCVFIGAGALWLLALVGLTASETAAVERIGVFRVITLLGRSQHAFPCARWIERARAGVLAGVDLAGTAIARLKCLAAPGWSVTGGAGRTVLRIHPESPRATRAAIKEAGKAPLCLLLDPAWEAPAHLCWPPDPGGALHPHTARAKGPAAAAFLIVTLAPGHHDQVSVVEDGIQLSVTARNLGKLTEALEAHESVDLPLPDMSKFCLRWAGIRAPQSRAPEAGTSAPDLPPPRPDVPLPSPSLAPAASWQTFTAALPGSPPLAGTRRTE